VGWCLLLIRCSIGYQILDVEDQIVFNSTGSFAGMCNIYEIFLNCSCVCLYLYYFHSVLFISVYPVFNGAHVSVVG
jgi:hypothetical protein